MDGRRESSARSAVLRLCRLKLADPPALQLNEKTKSEGAGRRSCLGGGSDGQRLHPFGGDRGGPGGAPVRWLEAELGEREHLRRGPVAGNTAEQDGEHVGERVPRGAAGADRDRLAPVLRVPRQKRPADIRLRDAERGKRGSSSSPPFVFWTGAPPDHPSNSAALFRRRSRP